MNLIAHPGVFCDPVELFGRPHENGDLIGSSQPPKRIAEIFILIRKGKFVFHALARFPKRCFIQIALFVPDQGCSGHSGVDAGKLARARFRLGGRSGKKVIFNTLDRKDLRVVKIPNHAVVLEILEEEGQPPCGVRPDSEVNNALVDLRIDIHLKPLRLIGDRLSGTASTVLHNFTLRRPDVDCLMTRFMPLAFFNTAVDFGRWSFARDETGIKLQIGQALFA